MDEDPFDDINLKQNSELARTEYDEEEDVYRLVYSVPDQKRIEGRSVFGTIGEYFPLEDEVVLEFDDPDEAAEYHFQEYHAFRLGEDPGSREIDLLVDSIQENARRKNEENPDDHDFFHIGNGHIADRLMKERIDLMDLADGTVPRHDMVTEEVLEDVMERYAEKMGKETVAENYSPEDSGIQVNWRPARDFHDLSISPEDVPDVEDVWNH